MVVTTSLPMQIFDESQIAHSRLKQAEARLGVLLQLYPSQYHFPNWIEPHRHHLLIRPTFDELRNAYRDVCARKAQSMERVRTTAEFKFLKHLKTASQKDVYPSTWIGLHCIDLFIPNVRSDMNGNGVMRGLAVEIDGKVHEHESKMKKDDLKLMCLSMIGVGVLSVANDELGESTVKAVRDGMSRFRTLDSRDRRRLWKRIYAFTLAVHLSDQEFFSLFSRGAL